jgi:hypothetical protein
VRRDDIPPLTRAVVLRIVGLAVAVALAGIAAWLIVTGTTQKRMELGVLAGLWSALLGAFSMIGARRPAPLAEVPASAAPSSTDLELRSARTQLERAEEVAARRAHEARLEQLLRAEVQSAIAREVSTLRTEIAELRSELLEKVGNQVRLERIETTRVIGSDLEALQQEVRQLQSVAREVRPVVEPARVRPVSREAAEVQAEVQAEVVPPRPAPTLAETTGPITPRPSPTPPPERDETGDESFTTLSGLPRIEPFTAFELDPIEGEPAYTGRRRRTDEAEGNAEESVGRRHRSDDDGNDLLARLLAREGR